jgi:hypothetical protein
MPMSSSRTNAASTCDAETVRLAGSLVGLASLRQMIQGETSVGGPIDLARVTKQDGFAWVRNKKTPASGYVAR